MLIFAYSAASISRYPDVSTTVATKTYVQVRLC